MGAVPIIDNPCFFFSLSTKSSTLGLLWIIFFNHIITRLTFFISPIIRLSPKSWGRFRSIFTDLPLPTTLSPWMSDACGVQWNQFPGHKFKSILDVWQLCTKVEVSSLRTHFLYRKWKIVQKGPLKLPCKWYSAKMAKTDLACPTHKHKLSSTIQLRKPMPNVNFLSLSSPKLILFLWNICLAFNLLD